MSSAVTLSNEEYDERKRLLEEIKSLVKGEQEEIFRIIKNSRVEFSENSNGVFFDLTRIPSDIFEKIKLFLEFCRKNRADFAVREEEEKKAQKVIGVTPV